MKKKTFIRKDIIFNIIDINISNQLRTEWTVKKDKKYAPNSDFIT